MRNISTILSGFLMLFASASNAQHGVFFSEYGEGTSYNKYVEIYNNTDDTVDLSDYMFVSCSNGCTVEGQFEFDNTSVISGGKIAPNDVFVIAHPSAEANIAAQTDATWQYFGNGDDWMALLWAADSSVVDAFGIAADVDTIKGWYVAGVKDATLDYTLYRKPSVLTGNSGDWAKSAGTDSSNSEWVVGDKPDGTFLSSDFGKHKVDLQREFKNGDLAIVAYRTSGDQIDDEFALLTFVDIKEGTQLKITDMKYTENGIAQCEGGLIWTAPAGVKSGDVILVGNDNVVVDTGKLEGDRFGLSSGGDQIIIYEGPFFNPNFVTALSSNAWSTSGITSCKGSNSLLPKGLTNGTNAISHESTNGNASGNTANAYFNGNQVGTIAEVKARVFDYSNWNGAASKTDQIWPKWSFFKEVTTPSFRLLSPANGADVTVEENDNTPVVISWEAEENALGYAWKLATATGSLDQPVLVIPSDNSGKDTTLTTTSGALDAALAGLSVAKGATVDLKWTVTAYFITGDSLNADTFHSIAITRKDDTPITYNFKEGDMAVVAYRMNASTPDEFALLTFVDIPSGAKLNFSDDKFAAGIQCDGGDLVWTAPAGGIKAGTVIAVLNDNPGVSLGTVTGGSFGLSSGGDQIMIFEGTPEKAQHITALSSNAWATSGVSCTTKSESEIPSNLKNGVNAISHEMTNGNDAGNTVNAYYTGTMEGTFDEIKKLVYDYNNWNGAAAGTEAQVWPQWNFTGKAAPLNKLSDLHFNLYPNPSNGTVRFNKMISPRVYNVSGVMVFNSEEKVQQLNLNHLESGIYFIKNEYGITRKLIIE